MHGRISVNNLCFARASFREQAEFWGEIDANCSAQGSTGGISNQCTGLATI